MARERERERGGCERESGGRREVDTAAGCGKKVKEGEGKGEGRWREEGRNERTDENEGRKKGRKVKKEGR